MGICPTVRVHLSVFRATAAAAAAAGYLQNTNTNIDTATSATLTTPPTSPPPPPTPNIYPPLTPPKLTPTTNTINTTTNANTTKPSSPPTPRPPHRLHEVLLSEVARPPQDGRYLPLRQYVHVASHRSRPVPFTGTTRCTYIFHRTKEHAGKHSETDKRTSAVATLFNDGTQSVAIVMCLEKDMRCLRRRSAHAVSILIDSPWSPSGG